MVIDGFHHVTCHTQICVGGRAKVRNMAMQISAYLSSLPWEARKRYAEKLNIGGVTLRIYGKMAHFGVRRPVLVFSEYQRVVHSRNTKGVQILGGI